ncbi:MAG: hypothetical protein PHQ86_04865, partial [Dehalococcoidales bacterium]|nr:hypothetical protein [Dehalococcoidales bacterium]
PPHKAARLTVRVIKNACKDSEKYSDHKVEIKIPKTKNAIKRNKVINITFRGLNPRIFIIINL